MSLFDTVPQFKPRQLVAQPQVPAGVVVPSLAPWQAPQIAFSVPGARGLGKSDWSAIFAPWNIASGVISAFEAPKVAQAQGQVALAQAQAQAAQAQAQAQSQQNIADSNRRFQIQYALGQVQAQQSNIGRRYQEILALMQQLAADYAQVPGIDPSFQSNANIAKSNADDIMTAVANPAIPSDPEQVMGLATSIASYKDAMDQALRQVQIAVNNANAVIAQWNNAQAISAEQNQSQEQQAQIAHQAADLDAFLHRKAQLAGIDYLKKIQDSMFNPDFGGARGSR